MKIGIRSIVLAAGLAVLADSASAALPKSFRVSPAADEYYTIIQTVYNSRLDRFVALFFQIKGPKDRLFCRVYDGSGKPVGGPILVKEFGAKSLYDGSAAYNAKQDRIFLVFSDWDDDRLSGLLLDGLGRLLPAGEPGGGGAIIPIKPSKGLGTCLTPAVSWLPTLDRYVTGWFWREYRDPNSSRNGAYLAVLDAALTNPPITNQVRRMTTRNGPHSLSAFVPYGDRILWGSVQDGTGAEVRPVAWITNLEGRILKTLLPGPQVKGRGWVSAAYNPVRDLFLLAWNTADARTTADQKSRTTYYRLMKGTGQLASAIKALPSTTPFPGGASLVYNGVEDRFFVFTPEYRSLASGGKWMWGAKLWGFYIGPTGALQKKDGTPARGGIPLTVEFTDPAVSTYLGPACEAVSATQGKMFLNYEQERTRPTKRVIEAAWAILY